ncbi:hypothetical protein GCM10008090_06600 [Arenicella chitinivorans]|uniref:CBM6 domain-containing protein n=1 Tax=Arenicella chitinivorans TaxID=1329800 RepID=A0A918RKF4_9GAMM|nr:pectate trisaccharide-lyase [Arenicella chitinivorans]GHA00484.1 hypothetical protein GCM10008090_06600 [Arenicella chitinivorans]
MRSLTRLAVAVSTACFLSPALTHAQATGFAGQNGGTTGGQGGPTVRATSGTQIHQALCSRPTSDSPIIIEVEGTINHGNTSKVSGSSCNTADDKIEIKDVDNVTIIGVGNGALFDQLGIHLRNANNIIVRNVAVRNVKKSGSPTSNGGDAIGMESDVSNVWVDHVTLSADGGESEGYDSLIDIKADTRYVTLSYSLLQGSDRGGLVGSSSSDLGNGPLTWHHNIFRDLNSRVPLLRGGFAHIYNNWYDGIRSTGINSRRGGEALIENNYFQDARNPIGTFYDDVSGTWDLRGNVFDNINWDTSPSDEDPAGPNPQSTASLAVPYGVSLDDAGCVPALLAQIAGANKGMLTSDGSCSAPDPDPDPDPDPTPDPDPDPNPGDGSNVELTANAANLNQADIENNHSGFTGSGFIDFENNSTSGASWSFTSSQSGNATIKLRFANGGGSSRAMNLSINGNTQQTIDFSTTGAWNNWSEISVPVSGLVTGTNELSVSSANPSGGPNIDKINVIFADTDPDPTPDPDPDPTPDPDPNPGDGSYDDGPNLSIGAGSDGSSKASGTSYGNVRDGNLSSYWSPSGNTGRISIKWSGGETINAINIVEAAGFEGRIGSWRVVNDDNDGQIASGTGAGVIRFNQVTLDKVNFVIDSASSQPAIAEFETYLASQSGTQNPDPDPDPDPTPDPDPDPNPNPGGGDDNALDSSGNPTAACLDLINNDNTNWDESSLRNEQQIVTCLSVTLGKPIGYGEQARGGYDASGGSDLVVIRANGSSSPEQQLAAAIDSDQHNWIVFDKDDFSSETEIAMYRLQCNNGAVQSALGISSASQCIDYKNWCANNGVSSSNCADEFFNQRLNDSDLPIRNLTIGSNTTLDGRGANVKLMFNGFKIGADSSGQSTRLSNSVIVTNLSFEGAGHTEDHGLDPDMLRVTGESNDVWIHKNSFINTGDAAFDVKVGAYNTTISFNRLVDVLRASLHGSSDSRVINQQITTTLHNNMFITTDAFYNRGRSTLRRVPLLRRGSSHHFNNVYVDYWKDIASVRVGGTLHWEDNLFVGLSAVQNEDSDLADAFSKWQVELSDGVVRDGSFTDDGSVVQFASGNCRLNSSYRTGYSGDPGNARNLSLDYSATSSQAIANNQMAPNQDLLDYVNATAGVRGATPYNSPIAKSRSQVLALSQPNCKQ